jgi:hypothetical protein
MFCKLMLKYIRTTTVTVRLPIDRVTNTMVTLLYDCRWTVSVDCRWFQKRDGGACTGIPPTTVEVSASCELSISSVEVRLCRWLCRLSIPMTAAGVSIIDSSFAACASSAASKAFRLFPMTGQYDEKNELVRTISGIFVQVHSLDYTIDTYLDSVSSFDRGNHCGSIVLCRRCWGYVKDAMVSTMKMSKYVNSGNG